MFLISAVVQGLEGPHQTMQDDKGPLDVSSIDLPPALFGKLHRVRRFADCGRYVRGVPRARQDTNELMALQQLNSFQQERHIAREPSTGMCRLGQRPRCERALLPVRQG